MAKAVVTTFGGIYPGQKPRALPGVAAQVANNLLANVPDFRPLRDDIVVATAQSPTNPVTMYRMAKTSGGAFNTNMSTHWILKSTLVSYARGPLNDDDTERTFYSFDDGSAPPRWMDNTGTDRKLGVPKPGTAPTAVPVIVDEFTTEERTAAITSALQAVTDAVRTSLTAVWKGAPEPGSGTTGYVNFQPDMASASHQGKQVRAYRTASTGGAFNGAISNTYTAYPPDNFTWVFDAALQPFWASATSLSPGWMGSLGQDHICLALPAYGLTYTSNETAMRTALGAIMMPGTTDGTKFLTTAQIDGLVLRLSDYINPAGAATKPLIDNLTNKFQEIRTLLDGGLQGASIATMTAFYAKAEVIAVFTSVLNSWAGAVFDAVNNSYNSSTPITDYTGSGPAGL